MTISIKIEACPWCGGKGELEHEQEHGGWDCHAIVCSQCDETPDPRTLDTRRSYDQFLFPEQSAEDAANNWNAWAGTMLLRWAAGDMREALIAAVRKLDSYVGVCSGDKELTEVILPQVRAALLKSQGQSTGNTNTVCIETKRKDDT